MINSKIFLSLAFGTLICGCTNNSPAGLRTLQVRSKVVECDVRPNITIFSLTVDQEPVVLVFEYRKAVTYDSERMVTHQILKEPYEQTVPESFIRLIRVFTPTTEQSIPVDTQVEFPSTKNVGQASEELIRRTNEPVELSVDLHFSFTETGTMLLLFREGDAAATYVGGLESRNGKIIAIGFMYSDDVGGMAKLLSERNAVNSQFWKKL